MNTLRIERLNGEGMETLTPEQASKVMGGGLTVTVWPYPTYSPAVVYPTVPFYAYGPLAYGYRPGLVYSTPFYGATSFSTGFYYGW